MIKLIVGPWAFSRFPQITGGSLPKLGKKLKPEARGEQWGQVQGFLGKLWVR